MPIEPDKIRAIQFVRQLEYSESMESTNTVALQLDSPKTPTLVVCDYQTGGRGRGANQWQSSRDNLAFSLIIDFHSEIAAADRLLLSPLTALAVCKSLERYHSHDQFLIKWPNDVYVCDRKICGILIESAQLDVPASGPRFVVGCGINVNASMLDATQFSAISLLDILGRETGKTELLSAFIDCFAECLADLSTNKESLLKEIRARCYLTGKEVTVSIGGRNTTGRCLGFADSGAILLRTESGEKAIVSGTVERF